MKPKINIALEACVRAMDLLFELGVIRSDNNPVADYGEYLAAQKFKLKLETNSSSHFDATDLKTGERYQIKARRRSRQGAFGVLGVIRDLEIARFDFLVVVYFERDFEVAKIYRMPKALVKKYGKFNTHQRGHILHLRGAILNDPRFETF